MEVSTVQYTAPKHLALSNLTHRARSVTSSTTAALSALPLPPCPTAPTARPAAAGPPACPGCHAGPQYCTAELVPALLGNRVALSPATPAAARHCPHSLPCLTLPFDSGHVQCSTSSRALQGTNYSTAFLGGWGGGHTHVLPCTWPHCPHPPHANPSRTLSLCLLPCPPCTRQAPQPVLHPTIVLARHIP